jgi:hypothetical protein
LNENLEKRSAWQKIQYRNPQNVSKNIVPPDTTEIIMPSNMSSESFSLNNSKFLQYDAPDQKIFLISDELILLHKTKWYLDGTFFLLKNVSYSQVYIISIFFDFGTHTYSYPLVFSFQERRNKQTYINLLTF